MLRNAPLSSLLILLVAVPAIAQESRSEIRDDAAMFSKEAIRKAQADLAEIDRDYRTAVTVETIDSLKGQTINEATERRAEMLDHQGIFVLIANKDHRAQVIASGPYREKLGKERLVAIHEAFTDQFREGKADEGLIRGVQAAASALAAILPKSVRRGEFESLPTRSVAKPGEVGASPLVVRQQVRLTLAGARKVLEGAEAKAMSMGQKSNIAVVDEGGHLLAFARLDGGRPASVATAITKATSAATFRQASGPLPVGGAPDLLLNLSLQDAAFAGGGRITSLRGGVPIVVDGQVIGAVGVGGGTGEQDAEVARAGVDAFLAEVPPATGPQGSPAEGGNPGSSKRANDGNPSPSNR